MYVNVYIFSPLMYLSTHIQPAGDLTAIRANPDPTENMNRGAHMPIPV